MTRLATLAFLAALAGGDGPGSTAIPGLDGAKPTVIPGSKQAVPNTASRVDGPSSTSTRADETIPISTPRRLAEAHDSAPTVYLVTMGVGRYVWERFGHNAIWIHDPARGTDIAYNYGLFDFAQEHFVLRFAQGRMWYWMDGAPMERYLRQYRRDNRSVWIQELNLPAEARRELQAFLAWNAQPEHRYYRYDYYRDNCSTRIRDALDRVLHGALRAQTESIAAGTTYRFHTRRLTANDLPMYTGLHMALGPAADRSLTIWEEMFLPLAMREHVRQVTVTGPDGEVRPLVASERILYASTMPAPPAQPPDWRFAYLAAGVLFGAAVVIASLRVTRRRARGGLAHAGLSMLAVVWGGGGGLAGVVLTGMWLATDHAMTYRNINLFYLNPLILPLAVLLPAAVYRARWAAQAGWWLACFTAGIAMVGLSMEAASLLHQVNGAVVALTLPVHLAFAFAARALARYSESSMPSIAASTISRGAVRQA